MQVDVRLDEIVLHALERDVERRYQHVSEIRTDVENVTSTPQVAPQTSPASSAPAPEHPFAAGMRVFMTPQPAYARQVGIPMMIFTGVWMVAQLAVTFLVPEENQTAHLLTLLAGMIGIPLGFLILSLRWTMNRGRQSAAPAATPTLQPSQPNFRQQDAKEILSVVMAVLYCLSGIGVVAGVIGLARLSFPALRTDMDIGQMKLLWGEAWELGGILILSLMALFLLPKARRQGRDRLARIIAANLVMVGAILTLTIGRQWFGLAVPYWLGGFYAAAAFVCWILLRGRDVKAAFASSANEIKPGAENVASESAVPASNFRSHWQTWCALLLLALCIVSVVLPSAFTGWTENTAFVAPIAVPGAGELSVPAQKFFSAGVTFPKGQIIAAACVIALLAVATAFGSRKKLVRPLALIVAGGITFGLALAHWNPFFTGMRTSTSNKLSPHDFQALAQGNPQAIESFDQRHFIESYPGISDWSAPIATLHADVKALVAKYPPGSDEARAIADGSSLWMKVNWASGWKVTAFLGVCALLFGIAGMIQFIAQRPRTRSSLAAKTPLT